MFELFNVSNYQCVFWRNKEQGRRVPSKALAISSLLLMGQHEGCSKTSALGEKESDIRRFQVSTDLIAETSPCSNGFVGVGVGEKQKNSNRACEVLYQNAPSLSLYVTSLFSTKIRSP
jgi:hypothetical protein